MLVLGLLAHAPGRLVAHKLTGLRDALCSCVLSPSMMENLLTSETRSSVYAATVGVIEP